MSECDNASESQFIEYPVAHALPSAPPDDWVFAEGVDDVPRKSKKHRSKWCKVRDKIAENQHNIDKVCASARVAGHIIYTQPEAVAIGAAIAGIVAAAICTSPAVIGGGIILYTLPKMTLFNIGTVNYLGSTDSDASKKEAQK